MLVDEYVFAQVQQYVLTDQYVIAEEQEYWPINISSLKSSNMRWLHQYVTKFNMLYNTYWNSYRIVQGVESFKQSNQ